MCVLCIRVSLVSISISISISISVSVSATPCVSLVSPDANYSAEICKANFWLGERFADTIIQFLNDADIDRQQVDLIGCHGQTIWHDVKVQQESDSDVSSSARSYHVTSTLQLGEPSVIAERTGITTVADFRVADVAAGGQGAPLVSVFDAMFLRPKQTDDSADSNRTWRAVVNIGGIGNVTLLPSVCPSKPPANILAFDTGPGNALIDYVTHKLSDGKLLMDEDGKLGAKGQPNSQVLARMVKHPYFAAAAPKTTGRETFGAIFADKWLEIAQTQYNTTKIEDVVATFTELTAHTIAQSICTAIASTDTLEQIIVAGGGSFNPTLMNRIQDIATSLRGTQVLVASHTSIGIDSSSKEAVVFALLACLCITGRSGNVPSCTGAKDSRILGKICPGRNFSHVVLNTT
jgi:anhydro-N-acetylmuramic acid kinase